MQEIIALMYKYLKVFNCILNLIKSNRPLEVGKNKLPRVEPKTTKPCSLKACNNKKIVDK